MRFADVRVLVLLLTISVSDGYAGELVPHEIAQLVQRLCKSEDAAGGLVVHVGCEDIEATAALSASGRLLVHGLVWDPDDLQNAQAKLMEQGLYGTITLQHWNGGSLPYVDDMVNYLVVDRPEQLAFDEVMRVLVPNGTAYLKSGDTWVEKTKSWPDDIDEWSHWLHGPDNNAVSKDRRVGISRSLQWFMPPRWSRHHNLPAGFNALVSGGGRIYYLVDQAPNAVYGPGSWVLIARDAFNGLELWRKEMKQWSMESWGASERFGGRVGRFHGAPDYQAPRRIVVAGDRIYVTMGFHAPVTAIDGATGKTLQEYPDTRNAGEISHRNGTLYVARNTYDSEPGKEIVAVDTVSGKTLWKNNDYKGIAASVGYQKQHTNAFITVGPEHLFLVDENDIVALDLFTGREAWKKSMPLTDEIVGDIDYRYSNFCTLVYHDGRVFFCQIHPGKQNLNKWEMKKLQIEAIDATTGKLLWDYVGGTLAHVTPADLFVNRNRVWTLDPALSADGDDDARLLGLDCQTGEVTTNFLLKNITHGHHHRCYRNKATENYYLMGEEGIEYIDFETGESDIHYWLRGACRYGVMPANGFVYVPPHNCSCYLGTLVYGLVALKTTSSEAVGDTTFDRLVKGSAYDVSFANSDAASEADWPMFRHDSMRSCGTSNVAPDELSQKWSFSPGGQLTPPVIVGDSVYVASMDSCQVYALSSTTGQRLWRFAADGPINAPPTYHQGRLVFGTRAGTLYVVTADRGELVWSFRAGPSNVHITAFGRLESPWPLDGSPLVIDGSIYCVAGRSMSLDSGLYLYKLDLVTGELLEQTSLATDTTPKGETDNNFLSDMLVSDGDGVFMKSIRFNKDDITQHTFQGQKNRRGSVNAPKEVLKCQTDMLDDSWLNCCFWAYGGCKAQQLVFDTNAVYGINGPQKVTWGGAFSHDAYRPGTGYKLQKWTLGKAMTETRSAQAKKKRKGRGNTTTGEWKDVRVDLRGKSMVLAGSRLYVAGTPDKTVPDDHWAAYENRRGALLVAVSKEDGEVIAEHTLASEPVYNGIAVAGGCLYMTMRDGSVCCWSKK